MDWRWWFGGVRVPLVEGRGYWRGFWGNFAGLFRSWRRGEVVFWSRLGWGERLLERLFSAFRVRLHLSRRSCVESCWLDGRGFCLKYYIGRHWKKAWRALRASYVLERLGLPVPYVYGLVEGRGGVQVLVMEYLPRVLPLHWYIRRVFRWYLVRDRERREMVEGLARYVAMLHNFGVYHRDLSAQNILVDGWSRRFYLIDLEDIGLVSGWRLSHLVHNFMQLGDLPCWVGGEERRYFFRCWLRALEPSLRGWVLARRRIFLERVLLALAGRVQERIWRDGWDWMARLEGVSAFSVGGEGVEDWVRDLWE